MESNDKIDIKIVTKNNQLKIYMDGLIHLCIKHDELIGLQSWLWKDFHSTYYIEFILKDREILTEYDDVTKWEKILKLLDEMNLFENRF